MKKYLRAILFGVAAMLVTACNLDFDNPNAYADATFWYSKSNAVSGLTACYLPLRNGSMFGGAAIVFEECATPNAYNYANDSGWNDLAKGTATSDAGIFAGRWKDCYIGIGRCNTLLKYIDVNEELSSEDIALMKAQARFLRALYYSTLITYYNNVPLITDEPSTQQLGSGRTDREEILAFIFSELKDCADTLPRSYVSRADVGRATAGAALALEARMRLYEASPLFNPDNDMGKWAEAASAAKKVMDMKVYSLYDDYGKLFTEAAENSSECIFDVEFAGSPAGLGHNIDLIMRQYNSAAPLRDLVDSYIMKDGKPREDNIYGTSGEYADLDPRFYMTIVYPGSTWMGETVTSDNSNTRFVNRQTGYIFKKFTVYSEAVPSTAQLNLKENCSPVNIMLMRYADILLTYAEAMNEQGLMDQRVWDETIRPIRKRAGFTASSALDFPGGNLESLREIIHRERRSEFAGEGLYYNDLRRWKEAQTNMNGIEIKKHDGTVLGSRSFNADRDYFWPVPSSEMELSPSLSPNNPGW